MNTGIVKFFNEEKGWGFITDDNSGRDIFVHKSGLTQPVNEGDKVTFEIEDDSRGPKAVNVTVAE